MNAGQPSESFRDYDRLNVDLYRRAPCFKLCTAAHFDQDLCTAMFCPIPICPMPSAQLDGKMFRHATPDFNWRRST